MNRRHCLTTLTATMLVPASVFAQPSRVVHVGVLRPGSRPLSSDDSQLVGIPKALGELGYVEGRNLVVETRFADGHPERLTGFARELANAHVDVIIAVGSSAVRAATATTPDIPTVMFGNFDPVALGLVRNLAQPGGNITGILIAPDGTLAGKRLELLKATVPRASRFALLAADDPAFQGQVDETRKAADSLGVSLSVFMVRGAAYAAAFQAVAAARVDALVVGSHTYFVRDRKEIIALAARYRLPAMYEWREQVEDGGLMSYSTSLKGLHQRIAAQVDRIVKGAKPGDLPIEQPTRFEFVVNMSTAKALGLAIPSALRVQIDEVVE